MIDFKGHRVEKNIILTCVQWYLAYPLSYRDLEEMMEERGVPVDHSNSYRWVQKFTPPLEANFRNRKKRPVARVGEWTRPISRFRVLLRSLLDLPFLVVLF
jgi:transposase-like protein